MRPVSSSARQRLQGPGADDKGARVEHDGTWPPDSKATPGMAAGITRTAIACAISSAVH